MRFLKIELLIGVIIFEDKENCFPFALKINI